MLYIVELSRLKLKSLDFSCNKIQEIPIEYRHMESLEELVLDSNPLISPPAHVSRMIYNNIYFRGMPSCKSNKLASS